MERERIFSSSSASRELGIPQSTLLSLEARGAVTAFRRDDAGRRLITQENLREVREYLERKKAAA